MKALWAALNERGIHTRQELDREIEQLPAMDLSLMIGSMEKEKQEKRKAV